MRITLIFNPEYRNIARMILKANRVAFFEEMDTNGQKSIFEAVNVNKDTADIISHNVKSIRIFSKMDEPPILFSCEP